VNLLFELIRLLALWQPMQLRPSAWPLQIFALALGQTRYPVLQKDRQQARLRLNLPKLVASERRETGHHLQRQIARKHPIAAKLFDLRAALHQWAQIPILLQISRVNAQPHHRNQENHRNLASQI
jgi:hypothetical protein